MTTSTASAPATTTPELQTMGILKGGAAGAIAGAIGNVVLYFVAAAVGVSLVGRFDPAAEPATLAVGHVAMASIVPAIPATLTLLGLNRFTAKPSRIFLMIAVAFGLLSMGGPATLADSDVGTKIVLALMHVISGITITGGLLRLGAAKA